MTVLKYFIVALVGLAALIALGASAQTGTHAQSRTHARPQPLHPLHLTDPEGGTAGPGGGPPP